MLSNTNENTYEIIYLSDLTNVPDHQDGLSPTWINALSKAFPEQTEKHPLSESSGTKRLLIPKTKLVIRCTTLVFSFIQAFASIWILLEELKGKENPNPTEVIPAVLSLRDALLEMKNAFVRLNDQERCVYIALVKAMTITQPLKMQYPNRVQVLEGCKSVCSDLSEQDVNLVIEQLLEKKVFKQLSEETLWVVW